MVESDGQGDRGRTRRAVKHFTDLEVWRRAHELFLAVLKDLDELPRTRAAAVLVDQTIRSVGSVGANLAEGFNRSKPKFLNAIEIALGEIHEAENWLYKLRDAGYIDRERINRRVGDCLEIGRMLSALAAAIRRRPD